MSDSPGQRDREAPKPPKYLVKVSDERAEIIKLNHGGNNNLSTVSSRPTQFIQPDPLSRPLQNCRVSMLDSQEKVLGPPHRYRSKVDSSNDAKRISSGGRKSPSDGDSSHSYYDSKSTDRDNNSASARHQVRPPGTLPQAAALRKFEPPVIAADYAGGVMASKRTAGGAILGSHQKRYVDEQHVPHWDETARYEQQQYLQSQHQKPARRNSNSTGTALIENAVGPENPVVPYNANISQCWDDEAGAVYYYNHTSGEASWLPPEI